MKQKPPFNITFYDKSEVRMGSPYNTSKIRLEGQNYNIPVYGWQDKFAWSDDFLKVILINYDFTDNIPGFNFYSINIKNNSVMISKRIFGLVNSIKIIGEIIKINKFLYDKDAFQNGKDCNAEELYSLIDLRKN